MAILPYKQYAINVITELTKDDDKDIVSKFIGELKRLTRLKRYTDYKINWVKLPTEIGKETYAIAYSDRRVIKVRVYQIIISNNSLEIWIENIDRPMDFWKLTPKQYQDSASFETENDAQLAQNSQSL